MKKIRTLIMVCVVLGCCIVAAGCTQSSPPVQTGDSDAVWISESGSGFSIDKRTLVFHPDGTGVKTTEKADENPSMRTFAWQQPDTQHFLVTFEDADIDTFTQTDAGTLTHDGKYYTCTQKGTLPQVTMPPASPSSAPAIVGSWECLELAKKGIKSKTLEFAKDGTGSRIKTSATGSVTINPFTWVPVGHCYLITYTDEEDDDTVRIVDGTLDHDGERYTRVA